MKRNSFSFYETLSALDGRTVILRDRLHLHLFQKAETDPGIENCSVYSLGFTYGTGKESKTASFPLTVRYSNGHCELWNSVWGQDKADSAVEIARQTHALSLAATYRRFTRDDLEANRIVVKNRQTMHTILSQGFSTDTAAYEGSTLKWLINNGPGTVGQLQKHLAINPTMAMLVASRLVRKGCAKLNVEVMLMGPSSILTGGGHANP